MELRVGGKYKVTKRLGQGAFGDIYAGVNVKTNEEVAIKLELLDTAKPQLHYEAKIYQILQGNHGIPTVYWFGVEGDYTVLIMAILGPNLQQLFDFCENNFSLKTVLVIAIQMIQRLEYLHSKNFVHRDMKPENILIGQGKKANTVYLIDFGLAKRYLCPKSGSHIPYKENKGIIGTAKYLSLSGHRGNEHSRRDDLESLGIVLIYFLRKGKLPWDVPKPTEFKVDAKDPNAYQNQLLKDKAQEQWGMEVLQRKNDTTMELLCEGCPVPFKQYMNYTRNLTFEQKPNYKYLRNLFEALFRELDLVDDGQYDWILHKQAILDKRAADEEAERRQKAAQALMMANSRAGKKNQAKMQLIEEEERKRKEEEERKAHQEEVRKQTHAKDIEIKGQKSMRQVNQAEAERLRTEVRQKITAKIKEIIKREEEAAKKQPEDDVEIDEEWMEKLLNSAKVEEEKKAQEEEEAKGQAAAEGEGAEEGKKGEEEEDDEENEEESNISSEEIEEKPVKKKKEKKKPSMGFAGVLDQLVQQNSLKSPRKTDRSDKAEENAAMALAELGEGIEEEQDD